MFPSTETTLLNYSYIAYIDIRPHWHYCHR